MSQKSRVAPGVLQGVAILLLIVTIPAVFFYFAVTRSLEKAETSNTVPALFGYQYVPVTSGAVSDILKEGSVVIIDKAQPEDVTERDVILYETPSVSQDNRVYGTFGISTVRSVSYDGETVFGVTAYSSPESGETIAISSSLLRGKVSWSIDYLGSLIDFTTKPYGFLAFVIVPVVLFLLFQILSIVLRATSRYSSEDDDDVQTEEDLEDEELLTVEDLAQKSFPSIKSETVSTLLNRVALVSPFMEKDLKEEEAKAEQQEEAEKAKVSGESTVGKNITFDQKTVIKPQIEQSMREISQLNHGLSPDSTKPAETSSEDKQQEAFQLHQTIEFDMEAIREKMLQEELLKDDEEQEYVKTPENKQLLDQILIDLRDTGLDFSFKKIRSENIKIEKNSFGNGFVIKTPKYKASIKVQIEEETT